MSCPICCRFQSRSLYVFYTLCFCFTFYSFCYEGTSVLHTSFFIIYSHRNIFLQLFIHSFSVLPFSLIFPVNLFNHYNTIFYFLSFLCSLFIICFTKYFELIIIYKIVQNFFFLLCLPSSSAVCFSLFFFISRTI